MDLTIVKFCAAEVSRQYDHHNANAAQAASAVGWMADAWNAAEFFCALGNPILAEIEELGSIVEPIENLQGFRQVDVKIGLGIIKGAPVRILQERLSRLLDFIPTISPEEFYKEFQIIHPFKDGNGRVGVILFNWLKGTLKDPISAPDCFKGENS